MTPRNWKLSYLSKAFQMSPSNFFDTKGFCKFLSYFGTVPIFVANPEFS